MLLPKERGAALHDLLQVRLSFQAEPMNDQATPRSATTHETWDTHCKECGGRGYGSDSEYHDDCTGKCGKESCDGPCECDCGKPLTRDELHKLHAFVRSLR